MTPGHALLAGRIRQDLDDLGRMVERVERAMQARRQNMAEPEILLHGAALNLHDVYTALERTFTQIASTFDQSTPVGPNWHRELVR